ncbi:GIY-YIG nuclease family protein [Bacillus vallismortis]|nr:GIY-YIG nuclease family protein [Bacillus vallismortis]MCY7919944.1 GIY-YIG nuclease family protein [Bacillus vallismortis]
MTNKKIRGIYKIVNKINNKVYIGSSVNIESRHQGHKREWETS